MSQSKTNDLSDFKYDAKLYFPTTAKKSKYASPSQQFRISEKILAPSRAKSQGAHKKQTKHYKERISVLLISKAQIGLSIPYKLFTGTTKKLIKQNQGIWCSVYKIWKLTTHKFEQIKQQLQQILIEYDLEYPPSFVIDSFRNITKGQFIARTYGHKIRYNDDNNVDFNSKVVFYDRLYPFQKQTLQFCVKNRGRILIGDEMGVGKTVQSLACACIYEQEWPLLIICPSALKEVWYDEIGKWMHPKLNKQQVIIFKKFSNHIKNNFCKILIMSYEIAAKNTNELQYFKVVICDQAHYLKNSQSKRTKHLLPFLSIRKRIFLLTGTPALAKPIQLYNLMSIIRPDLFYNVKEFGNRYCQLVRNAWTHHMQFQGCRNSAELYFILRNTMMIRRLKQDVLQSLPSKQRQVIQLATDKSITREILDLLSDDKKITIHDLRNSDKIVQSLANKNDMNDNAEIINQCYMLTGMAKLVSIKQYLQSILQNDVKIVVFAHHKIILDELELYLEKKQIKNIRIDGNVNLNYRMERIKNFQDNLYVKIALLSITTAALGYTLTAATTVIFAQLYWTPALMLQAEDRVHRMGQKSCVNIHYLLGEGTLDALLMRQIEKKMNIVGKLLNAQQQGLNCQEIQKGQIGTISKPNTINSKAKEQKITDYFHSLGKHNNDENMGEQLSEDSILIKQSRKKKALIIQYQKSIIQKQ